MNKQKITVKKKIKLKKDKVMINPISQGGGSDTPPNGNDYCVLT